MCLYVEVEHLRAFLGTVETKVKKLLSSAHTRQDWLIKLDAASLVPAVLYRDFTKTHGNLIQKAVGIALDCHSGGYSQTSLTFPFLSGLSVEVDNFFMSSTGRIYLFETKRDQKKIREEGVAGRNLYDVKEEIERQVRDQTGRPLRYPIEVAYFSFRDHSFIGGPKSKTINIGTKKKSRMVDMPIYSRADMNKLIGSCFGTYLGGIDALFSDVINQLVPGAAVDFDGDRAQLPFSIQSLRECSDAGIRIGAVHTPKVPKREEVLLEE